MIVGNNRITPSFSYWAGWIGKESRKPEGILNTEYLKFNAKQVTDTGKCNDQLCDEFLQELFTTKDVSKQHQ